MDEAKAAQRWTEVLDLAESAVKADQPEFARKKVYRFLVNASTKALTKARRDIPYQQSEAYENNAMERKLDLITRYLKQGKMKKALSIWNRSTGRVDMTLEPNRRNLAKRFLKDDKVNRLKIPEAPKGAAPVITTDMVVKVLREKESGKSPGLDDITFDFLKALLSAQTKQSKSIKPEDPRYHYPTARFAENLTSLVSQIIDGSLAQDQVLREWMTTNKGTALPKGEPVNGLAADLRPISIMPAIVSLAHTVLLRHPDVTQAVKHIISQTDLSNAVRGGPEAIPWVLQGALNLRGNAVIQIDFTNAFGSILHQRVLDIANVVPPLAATLIAFYGTPSLTIFGRGTQAEQIETLERGFPQGGPLSGLLLALSTRTPETEALAKRLGVVIYRYIDDVSFVGPAEHLPQVLLAFCEELRSAGPILNPQKCGSFIPDHVPLNKRQALTDLARTKHIPIVQGLTVLGIPIGSDEYVTQKVSEITNDALDTLILCKNLVESPDIVEVPNVAQIVMTIIRLAIVPASICYLIRVVPERLLLSAMKRFDDRIIAFIMWLLDYKTEYLAEEDVKLLQERVWLDAVQGGAGICSMTRLIPHANLGAVGLSLHNAVDRGMIPWCRDDGTIDLPTAFPDAHQHIQNGYLNKVAGLEKDTLQDLADKPPQFKLQKRITLSRRSDRLNAVLALMDVDLNPRMIPVRADFLSRGSYPASAWLYAIIQNPKHLAQHCILKDEDFVCSLRALLGVPTVTPFHDPRRVIPAGKVVACGFCAPGAKGAPSNKVGLTYLFSDQEASLHSARCGGKAEGAGQPARTKGHSIIQGATQTVATRVVPQGDILQVKRSPPMKDYFAQAKPKGASASAPVHIGVSLNAQAYEENKEEDPAAKKGKEAGVYGDLAVISTNGATILDFTMRSYEMPRTNTFCRPPPRNRLQQIKLKCNAAHHPNSANNAARVDKFNLYKKKWNLDSNPDAKLVIAAIEHGGRWDEPFKQWFDDMFKNAIEDKNERAWRRSKGYQIIAVAARKAVAGIQLASQRLSLSVYRIVDPPKELAYLLQGHHAAEP